LCINEREGGKRRTTATFPERGNGRCAEMPTSSFWSKGTKQHKRTKVKGGTTGTKKKLGSNQLQIPNGSKKEEDRNYGKVIQIEKE